jgi:hypothetical protein
MHALWRRGVYFYMYFIPTPFFHLATSRQPEKGTHTQARIYVVDYSRASISGHFRYSFKTRRCQQSAPFRFNHVAFLKSRGSSLCSDAAASSSVSSSALRSLAIDQGWPVHIMLSFRASRMELMSYHLLYTDPLVCSAEILDDLVLICGLQIEPVWVFPT